MKKLKLVSMLLGLGVLGASGFAFAEQSVNVHLAGLSAAQMQGPFTIYYTTWVCGADAVCKDEKAGSFTVPKYKFDTDIAYPGKIVINAIANDGKVIWGSQSKGEKGCTNFYDTTQNAFSFVVNGDQSVTCFKGMDS